MPQRLNDAYMYKATHLSDTTSTDCADRTDTNEGSHSLPVKPMIILPPTPPHPNPPGGAIGYIPERGKDTEQRLLTPAVDFQVDGESLQGPAAAGRVRHPLPATWSEVQLEPREYADCHTRPPGEVVIQVVTRYSCGSTAITPPPHSIPPCPGI